MDYKKAHLSFLTGANIENWIEFLRKEKMKYRNSIKLNTSDDVIIENLIEKNLIDRCQKKYILNRNYQTK